MDMMDLSVSMSNSCHCHCLQSLVLHKSKFVSLLYIFSEIHIVDMWIQNLYNFSGSWTNSRNLASNLLLRFGHIYSHSKSFNKWLPLANRYKYLFPRYTILLYLLTNSKHNIILGFLVFFHSPNGQSSCYSLFSYWECWTGIWAMLCY